MHRAKRALLLPLLLLLLGCGPAADTGTRHPGPNGREGTWSIYWWPNANATMQKYLLETVREHDALLHANLNGERVPPAKIHFYQTIRELATAHGVTFNTYGFTQLVTSPTQAGNGIGFIHPLDRSIHVYAGPKLSAPVLGHLMLHVVLVDPMHLDPRWSRFAWDDYLLSIAIAARR